MAVKLDLKYLYLCSSAHDCIANYKFEWWYCLLTVALNCFQARKQPATCSVFQLCYCILIQTFLKGECFLLPVVMIVMVLSNLFSVSRLQSEIDEVLGNKESVSAEDLEKLQYTEQVYVLDSHLHNCLVQARSRVYKLISNSFVVFTWRILFRMH